MQSSLAPPAPPYLHMKFATFEDAKENYRSYAKFHGFAVYTDHRKKLIKTGEYNRAELRCFKSRKNKKKGGNGLIIRDRRRDIMVKMNCPARMKLNVEGAWWVVTKYVGCHNHEMIKKFDLIRFLSAHVDSRQRSSSL